MSDEPQISIDAEKLVDKYEQAIIGYHKASSLCHEDDQHDAATYRIAQGAREKLVGRIASLEYRAEKAEARVGWAELVLNEIMVAADEATVGSAFEDLGYIGRIAKETIRPAT